MQGGVDVEGWGGGGMAGKKILGLVWAEQNPSTSGSRTLGVLELTFAPGVWSQVPGPMVDAQSRVQDWLWTQWVLRQLASWWVGLCLLLLVAWPEMFQY